MSEIMQATPEKTRTSAEEFAQLPESNQFIELIEGEIIVSPTPVDQHQDNAGDIYVEFKLIARQFPERGRAKISPLEIHFDDENILEPDVFWISSTNKTCVLGDDGYWYGAPDLVVEVLSPSTARRDRQKKRDLYEKFGVREYWIVDPIHHTIEQLLLTDGKYDQPVIYGEGDSLYTPVIDHTFEVNALLGLKPGASLTPPHQNA